MYAVVDIETTGGNSRIGKIIEISVFHHDGKQYFEAFHSLVNPEEPIPPFITGLTGINNQMVVDAPPFKEIADEFLQVLRNRIFIAHNVQFDYGFIKEAFRLTGINFESPRLCTVRLSRKILPGFKSYGLGNLTEALKIKIKDRHRATGDAEATAEIFTRLLSKDENGVVQKTLKRNSKESILPPNLPRAVFDELPNATGVYYFQNEKGKILYVGKAIKIKKRIEGHFSYGSETRVQRELLENIFHISYELTGSELVALIHECHEIKRLWPPFNRSYKYQSKNYGIYTYEDRFGYTRFSISKTKASLTPELRFDAESEARGVLDELIVEYQLCPKLCGRQNVPGSCTHHHKGDCLGACIEAENTEAYNKRAWLAIKSKTEVQKSFAIIGIGRTEEEKSVVLIEKGSYKGFGFLENHLIDREINEIKAKIEYKPDDRDIRKIVSNFIIKVPREAIRLI